ncbi:MAG: amine dehydrogenase large subunit, partial [Myxococcota bacterium]|nr:amine dehydrogenase large subunit [Myxococcota bacterium]
THAVWVPDRLFAHSKLFDGDSGEMLGAIDGGVSITPKPPLLARGRGELYSVDIVYSRGRRGARSDFVTIYDARTLGVTGEIPLPTRTAESNASLAHAELLDGERFLGVFNQFPNTSVSVVDLGSRRFVEEILLTGCAGVFPVDSRRFASLCGDGTAALVTLDETGRKADLTRTERFFDVVTDPVAMSAARDGARWLFVSFEGQVHEVDFGAAPPRVAPPWSLLDDADRAQGWRPGGLQYVALHRGSGRLYTVQHRGGPGSHKDAGPEIWVHDVATRERVDRFAVPNLTAGFLGPLMGLERDGWGDWLLRGLLPDEGAHTIAVTQDAEPLLFARNAQLGVVAVLDARSGEHLRDLEEAGLAGPTLRVPGAGGDR